MEGSFVVIFFFLERSIVGCWVRGYLDDILKIVYMFM